MSQKSLKNSKRPPRAMPVETIITRFKSAQQKHNSDKEPTKNSSSKKITDSNTPTQKTTSKYTKKTPLKSLDRKSEKHILLKKLQDKINESKEFYPEKLKRKLVNKKIVLTPKNVLKLIGGIKSCNKRKLHVPQKDTKYFRSVRNGSPIPSSITNPPYIHKTPSVTSELSIGDMVRLIDESECLGEEDLLEILTCPSPVWWEDPPDGYVEEAIFSRDAKPEKRLSVKRQLIEEEMKAAEDKKRKNGEESNNNKVKDTDSVDPGNVFDSIELSVEKRGNNFLNRRCHLEALLGNIKNKTNSNKGIVNKAETKESDLCNNNNNNEVKSASSGKEFISDNYFKNNGNTDELQKCNKDKRSSGSIDDDQLYDLRDDDVLRDLENMNIPIEQSKNEMLSSNDSSCDNIKDVDDKSKRNSVDSVQSENSMSLIEEYLDLSVFDDDEYEANKDNDTAENKINKINDEMIEVIDLDKQDECDAKASEGSELNYTRATTSHFNFKTNETGKSRISNKKTVKVQNKVNKNINKINENVVDVTNKERKIIGNYGKIRIRNDLLYEKKPYRNFPIVYNVKDVNNKDYEITAQKDKINRKDSNESYGKIITYYKQRKNKGKRMSEILKNERLNEINDNNMSSDSSNIDDMVDRSNIKDKNKRKIVKSDDKTDEITNNSSSDSSNTDEIENKNNCRICSVKNRTIIISESEKVKYCLICSSIFDTEACKYCLKSCSCCNADSSSENFSG